VVKKVSIGFLVALALVGLFGVVSGIQQIREDYSNFRKIVQWVAIKQQQEELARQKPAPKALTPDPAPAPPPAAPAGK
jgi:hypothetical protein